MTICAYLDSIQKAINHRSTKGDVSVFEKNPNKPKKPQKLYFESEKFTKRKYLFETLFPQGFRVKDD